LTFALYVRNDNRRPRLIKLIAACGALDIDDPQPAITVMMPDEIDLLETLARLTPAFV
jgi:hypothetical protein